VALAGGDLLRRHKVVEACIGFTSGASGIAVHRSGLAFTINFRTSLK